MNKIENNMRFLGKVVQSFFSTWALMKACRMEPGNILTLVFFLLCLLFFYRHEKPTSAQSPTSMSTTRRITCILSLVFTTLYVLVDYTYYIQNLTNTLFRIGIIASVVCGFYFLFYHLLSFFFYYTGNAEQMSHSLLLSEKQTNLPVKSSLLKRILIFYSVHTGLSGFLLCLLCWLPYFLYQFPGIMTPDSINQLEQVLGIIPYSNHHPWAHTLLIKLLYSIGYGLTGNMEIAMSFYTFFQMCIMALTVWYFINTLKRFYVKPFICLAITLFYALIPFHAVYSVTVWKDILFAGAVLLFGCSFLRFYQQIKIYDVCIFFISGLMMCLFRSNGWYAMLLCLPFLLIGLCRKRSCSATPNKRFRKLLLPTLLCIYLIAALFKYPIMNAYDVKKPDFIEFLAIPTQQITAVLCNDRELTQEQQQQIENVIDLTHIKALYDSHYADNIKELVRAGNQDYLIAHKGEFLKLWIQLGLKYPGDYLKAYIDQTYGYWYPGSFYRVAEGEGISASNLGISHTPLIGGPLVVKTKEIAIKLGSMLPLYGTLWSMGVACWLLIFSIGNALVRQEKQKLLLYLPSAAILLSVLIATPVATDFRYAYFMVFSLPFYLITTLLPLEKPSIDAK